MKALDPVTYWRERGKVYEREPRLATAAFVDQESALERLLTTLAFDTALDVGCGFGRIGELVRRIRPDADYTGIDISPDQLRAARRRLGPSVRLVEGDLRELLARDARYDLVLAVEVLMHVPPRDIGDVVAHLRSLSMGGHLVTVDWDAPGAEAGGYCWGHDYAALLPGAAWTPVGRQAIWHLG